MNRRGLPLFIALVPLALTACGGDDAAPTADQPAVTLPAGGTVPPGSTARDPSDVTLPPGVTLPDVSGVSLPELPDMPGSGDGSCSVEVTGDVEASWGESQNVASAMVSDWFTEAQRDMLGDSFTLLFNCEGDGDNSFSLISSNAAGNGEIPHAPGTYEISGGAGLFGAEGDLWTVLIGLDGTDTNWSVAEPGGTLTISEFDDDTIAFEFDAPLYDSLAEMAGTDAQAAHITVSMTYTRV